MKENGFNRFLSFILILCLPAIAGWQKVELKELLEAQKNNPEFLVSATPVLEIKRLESGKPLYSIELREVQLVDFFRVIACEFKLNILINQNVSGAITASFTNISLEEALDAIAELNNLSIEKKGNIIKVSSNLVTKTGILKYNEAERLPDTFIPAQASSKVPSVSAPSGTGLYGQLSAKDKILLGQQQNPFAELEFMVENARKDIQKQGSQALAQPKAAAVISEKAQQLDQEETARQGLVQEQVLKQQEKAPACAAKPKEANKSEKKQVEALIAAEKKAKEEELKKKQEQVKFLAEQKAQEQKLKEEKKRKELDQKKEQALQKEKDQQLRDLARKKQKEEAWAMEKQEQEQLLAQQKEQLLIAERERQMKLSKEADKKAKDEKYVSDLQALLERQNSLLKESNNLELKISQEQENLKALEKNREAVLQKLLEKPSE